MLQLTGVIQKWALSREAGNLENYVNTSHILLVGPNEIKRQFVMLNNMSGTKSFYGLTVHGL